MREIEIIKLYFMNYRKTLQLAYTYTNDPLMKKIDQKF